MTEKRALKKKEIDEFISSLQVPFGRTPISLEIHQVKMAELKKYLGDVTIYPAMIPKLLQQLRVRYYKSIVSANTAAGIASAQTMGENATQSALNTHRFAGLGNSLISQGVPGMVRIFAASANQKHSNNHVYLNPKVVGDVTKVKTALDVVRHRLKPIRCDILCTDIRPVEFEKDQWWYRKKYSPEEVQYFIRLVFDVNMLHYYRITLAEITTAFLADSGLKVEFSPMVVGEIHVFVCDVTFPSQAEMEEFHKRPGIMEKMIYYYIRDDLIPRLRQLVIRGIHDIDDIDVVKEDEEWMITTLNGTFSEILTLDFVDSKRTYTNDIIRTFELLGIEAAKEVIIRGLTAIVGSDVDKSHIQLIANSMCVTGNVLSVSRHGLKKMEIETIKGASFEEIIASYLDSALISKIDPIQGVSSCVAVGQRIHNGTGAVELLSTDKKVVEILEMM